MKTFLGLTTCQTVIVYSRVVRRELSPPKISDSPPKVVNDLATATLIELIFTKSALRFNLRATNMQNFLP